MGLGLQMFDRQNLSYSKTEFTQSWKSMEKIVQFKFDQLDYSDSKIIHQCRLPQIQVNKNKIQKLFFQIVTFMKSMNAEVSLMLSWGNLSSKGCYWRLFRKLLAYNHVYRRNQKGNTKQKLEGKLIEPRLDYILTMNDKEVYFKKTFFENAIIQIEEAKNTISIGPNLFPFNNPYELIQGSGHAKTKANL